MLFHDSANQDIDDAANLVRSLTQRLKYSSYYGDIPRVSDATLDNLRRFDDLLAETSSIIRQYLNTAAPINRCPGEILSAIFALSATETMPSFSSGHGRVPFVVVQKLRPITLVCRSWRNFTLHTPSLWCDIVVDRRQTEELGLRCLALAKAVPLRIHARYGPRTSSHDIVYMLKEYGNRVQEAYLRVDNLGWDEIIDSLPLRPLLLTHLTIDGGLWRCRRYKEGGDWFGGLAQVLRRLYAHGAFCLPTDKFPNLTHFVAVTTGSYAIRTVLSILSNMPRLQTIILTIEIEEASIAQRDWNATIELTHLRRFSLKDCSAFTVKTLLPMIKIPSTCIVQIDEQMQEDLVSIASLLYTQDFARDLTRLRIIPDPTYNDGDEDNEDSLYFFELFNDAGTGGLSLGIHEPYSGLWTADDRARVTETLVEFLSSPAGASLVSSVTELWIHNWTDLLNAGLRAAIPRIHTLGLVLARPPYIRTEIPGPECPFLTSLYVYTCGAEDIDRVRMLVLALKNAGRPLHRLAIECEHTKEVPGVQSRALELGGLVPELSVTIGEKKRAWWKPCVIPPGWSRHGLCPWPDWQE